MNETRQITWDRYDVCFTETKLLKHAFMNNMALQGVVGAIAKVDALNIWGTYDGRYYLETTGAELEQARRITRFSVSRN